MIGKKIIKLGALEVSRLIAGGNQISGFAHQSSEIKKEMKDYFSYDNHINIKKYFYECECNNIDAIVARTDTFTISILKKYWNEDGKIKWLAQTAPEYEDIYENINLAKNNGASAVIVHGGYVDRLFLNGQENNLVKIISYIKKFGIPAGIAAHDPVNHLKIQQMNMNHDFHMVCMYNINGHQGNKNIQLAEVFDDSDRIVALKTMLELKRPCILYKILAAGRKTLEYGLSDIKKYIRPFDGILIGAYLKKNPQMIRDNAEAVYSLN